MKQYLYKAGAVVLALAMSGVPAIVAAESNQGDGSIAQTQESIREQQKQSAEVSREQGKQDAEVSREQQKQLLETSSSTRPQIKGGDVDKQEIGLEDDTDVAFSFGDLKQKIEKRMRELNNEEASSTPDRKDIMKNANEVRLAVHSLLASKDLLGGIGQQVSEIAREINHSVATTTDAEVKIHSRGFFTHLFFGGDKTSAEVITKEAEQNQVRIDSLTALLAQANVPADIQAILSAQITALKDAQARLQEVAQAEQKAWGLFSWRF
ncbi:MAG: hypothetical protein WAW90_00325 [Minisyncoccia bacterium]